MKTADTILRTRQATARSLGHLARDLGWATPAIGRRVLELGRDALALLGLAVLAAALVVAASPAQRAQAEAGVLQWLQARVEQSVQDAQGELPAAELDAVARATAVDPAELSAEQARVAQWIARRYRVAPEPVGRLVQEAWEAGRATRLEPTLILAVVAVESRFNPFAQSPVGAQGLMQVMTSVHDDKYEPFGGNHAAFDPVTNLRVGVQVLKDCIRRFGGVEGGLRCYVGASLLDSDGGYAAKVSFEQRHLARVARGERVPVYVRFVPPRPAAPAPEPVQPAHEAAADPVPAPAPAPDSVPAGPVDAPAAVALADSE